MKIRIASILFMFLTLLPIYGKSENHGAVKANFDERIELMSIICHLAGFQEYNMNLGGDYITEMDAYFAEAKTHPAVVMMDSLRRSNGIAYDSPMAFAVNLTKRGDSFVLVNETVVPEKRWKGMDLEKVAATITDFYTDSKFSDFFNAHKPFYEEVCSVFNANVLSKFNQGWYEKFYGMPPTDNFEIIIGFTNGGGNYGPSRNLPGEPRDVYAIIGFAYDDNGEPYYKSEPEMYLGTLVHEFNHSFVNPLTDVNSAMIEKAGKNLMKFSEKAMRKNSYNNWQTIINESIVRAAVVLYQLDNGASADFVRQLVVDEMATGFYWMPDLVDCLQSYSKQRDKYPSLESYYPVIADFFKSYTDELTRKVNTVK